MGCVITPSSFLLLDLLLHLLLPVNLLHGPSWLLTSHTFILPQQAINVYSSEVPSFSMAPFQLILLPI